MAMGEKSRHRQEQRTLWDKTESFLDFVETGGSYRPRIKKMIYLTHKRVTRDFFLFLQRYSKVTKKRLFEPQKSLLIRFGGQKVSF